MPEDITEAPQDKAARGASATAQEPTGGGTEFADAEITMVGGQWDIKLTMQSQSEGQEEAGAAATTGKLKEVNITFRGSLRIQEDRSPEAQRRRWFKEMRGWLMVLATVAASASYQAGLNPPGGFWQDNNSPPANGSLLATISPWNGTHHAPAIPVNGSHHAGDPVLRDEHHSRYLLFYYFNATAFVTSLVIMVLLMSERFYHTEAKVVALMLTTFVDLASLIGAYVAGTTRYFSSCIYVIVITCVAFVGVIYIGEMMTEFCIFIVVMFPCMETLAKKKWCPILPGVVENARKKKEEREHRGSERKRRNSSKGTNNTGTACCACCAQPRVAA